MLKTSLELVRWSYACLEGSIDSNRENTDSKCIKTLEMVVKDASMCNLKGEEENRYSNTTPFRE